MTNAADVTIHVDPACPWAWLTSRWLAEVEKVRPIRVTTRLFDLAEANRSTDADEGHRRSHGAGEVALRVLVAARRAGGDEALARLYTELGEAHHERGEPLDDQGMLSRALAAAGLDPGLEEAARNDPTTLDELLAEHRAIAERGAFGVPTLVLGDAAPTFGPVIDTRITGEAAGELWDRVAWLLTAPSFYELKRERTHRPEIGRYRALAALTG
ncbi:MAG: DsbA family protein [Candidatus Dormiibacterota bacterium]|jgi:predicted DsbA family dithiol-disulfide isomerase